MLEVASRRERRRREDPGAAHAVFHFRKGPRDAQGRIRESRPRSVGFKPTHRRHARYGRKINRGGHVLGLHRLFAQLQHLFVVRGREGKVFGDRHEGAPGLGFKQNPVPGLRRGRELLVALLGVSEGFGDRRHFLEKPQEGGNDARKKRHRRNRLFVPGFEPRRLETHAQGRNRRIHPDAKLAPVRAVRRLGDPAVLNPLHREFDFAGRKARRKEVRRDRRELMRFVHDRKIHRGEHSFGALLHRHGRQIEVMVHHHDLRALRAFARAAQKAFVREGTVLDPETALDRARHHGPERIVVGNVGEFRSVARLRNLGEALDFPELFEGVPFGEVFLPLRALEVVVADVVGAALEERRVKGDPERFAQNRQVLAKELVLKGLPRGRNDDALSRQERGREVGKGLPRARPGLGDEGPFLFDRVGRFFGVGDLRGTLMKFPASLREGPFGRERDAGALPQGTIDVEDRIRSHQKYPSRPESLLRRRSSRRSCAARRSSIVSLSSRLRSRRFSRRFSAIASAFS